MHRARWRRRHRPAGDGWRTRHTGGMAWTRFSLAGTAGATLDADAVRYGPGLPTESELKLLGHVEGRRVLELGCGGGRAPWPSPGRVPGSSSTTARPTWARPASARSARACGWRRTTGPWPSWPSCGPTPSTPPCRPTAWPPSTTPTGSSARCTGCCARTGRSCSRCLIRPSSCSTRPAASPVLRRAWWDTSPVTWSVAEDRGEPDRMLTLTGLFADLNRAGFAVDTLLEPAADRAEAGEAWSTPCAGCRPPHRAGPQAGV